jgi:uncharacterized lipoprotein YddW (UPF0748 family)
MAHTEATGREKESSKIVLSTPVTHSDWRAGHQKRIGRGKDSVKYILDRCKEVGWQRIYWRCMNGGNAVYDSKLVRPIWEATPTPDWFHAWHRPGETIDLSYREGHFDTLQAAVEYGHSIGLEIHAWLSINEDDHAWGCISKFSREHPQFRWVKRSGMPYNSQLSFAFEEVRQYKLAIVKEILGYDIDGVFFDWVRTGDVRNDPQVTADGAADFGYEKPLVEGFEKEYGLHPTELPNWEDRWVRYRAEPQTIFMREARKLIKGKSERLSISVMGAHPWYYRWPGMLVTRGNLHGMLLDTETWAGERLMDEIVPNGNYADGTTGTPEKAYASNKREVGDRCNVWLYWWVPPDVEDFRKSIAVAESLGARQILYWESNYIDNPDRQADAKELAKAMHEYGTA